MKFITKETVREILTLKKALRYTFFFYLLFLVSQKNFCAEQASTGGSWKKIFFPRIRWEIPRNHNFILDFLFFKYNKVQLGLHIFFMNKIKEKFLTEKKVFQKFKLFHFIRIMLRKSKTEKKNSKISTFELQTLN